MFGIILQILKAAKKDSLFLGMACFIVLSTVFSIFIGSNAIVEKWEMKIIYASSIGRIMVMSGLMIFLVFYIKRLFENKEIEVILSRPISRIKIIFAMNIGFSILVILMSIPLLLALLLLKVDIQSLLVWYFTILMEGKIVLSFTLFFALLIRSQVYSLCISIMMYILSRSIGALVSYVAITIRTDSISIAETIMKLTSTIIPRLDLFGKSSWLIYSDYTLNNLFIAFVQTVVFVGLVTFACVYDFRKKEF